MNILFLDLDGVLNSEKYVHEIGDAWTGDELDPQCIKRLNDLTDKTGARIVISSSWRNCYSLDQLRLILKENGVKGIIIGSTPILNADRSEEINSWYYNNKDIVSNYVIFDDDRLEAARDSSDPVLDEHFVRTSWLDGLQDIHIEKALKILKVEK